VAIAVFSDIYGNLEALEAIIKHAKKNRKIKQIYCLGDSIVFGPDSSACLKLLKKYDIKCVVGNHEQRVVRYDKAASKTRTYANAEHLKYIFASLDAEDLRFIKSLLVQIKINYKDVNIWFTHYYHNADGLVRDYYEEFTEDLLKEVFTDSKCDVVFFGHIRKRKIIIDEAGKSFVCCGSSGLVKGDKTFYTYFDISDDDNEARNFDIYRINVPFNRKRFEEKLNKEPLPMKEVYAEPCFGVKLEVKK